ncbi:hypothetical protein B0T21DRAFT_325116 [Apiosordaria backusii]|uniref:AA1-like domain-containing protein n=1 Tax=Apiosordaria backusii TaxID=314023 RepID=A0AA40K3F8_9PEZI|nr:hypothetical protein B0T21DRAFT_325116 [Apiosordaria backusii]
MLLTLFVSLATVAAALPSAQKLDRPERPPLKPLEINTLSTFAPSGRPGSSLHSFFNVSFTDPEFNNTTVQCGTQWTYDETDTVWTRKNSDCLVNPKSKKVGEWSFQLLKPTASGEGASLLNNFMLHLRHDWTSGVHVATQKFGWDGKRNIGGMCSASGVCQFGLWEGVERPYLVPQFRLER